jgi:hypothetical protein
MGTDGISRTSADSGPLLDITVRSPILTKAFDRHSRHEPDIAEAGNLFGRHRNADRIVALVGALVAILVRRLQSSSAHSSNKLHAGLSYRPPYDSAASK